jgi:3-oxoacyl-[acyl-carrier-protein] synthase II
MSRPVAVTGLGVVSALGIGVGPFWAGLVSGRTGCGAGRRVDVADTLVAEVVDLEGRDVVRSPQGRRIDRVSLLGLAAARLALADAGLVVEALDPTRTALALGSAFGNVGETEVYLDRILARGTGTPLLFPNLVMNAPLSYAAIELGITGAGAMLTEQEASGESAVAWGVRQVADGAAETCLAGGCDEITAGLVRLCREIGAAGGGPPRPLDLAADGPTPGEGAAVLVLETPERARARGARIYALIRPHEGAGVPAPVHGWPRDGRALADILAPLLGDADAIVAAASGSPRLDAVEAQALALACAGRRLPITAPRGAIGDFGAAGALCLAAGALAIHHGLFPPTAGCRLPARRDLDVVVGAPRALPLRAVIVDGLARGGMCRPLRLEAA